MLYSDIIVIIPSMKGYIIHISIIKYLLYFDWWSNI